MWGKSISDSDSEIEKCYLPCLDLLRALDFHLFWSSVIKFHFQNPQKMNWPCLSAAPPSYTEDTTNFPNGESAPPSRAMSSCPALPTVSKNNQTLVVHFKSYGSSNQWTYLKCGLSEVVFTFLILSSLTSRPSIWSAENCQQRKN